jgi:hypothetical protein
MQVAQCRASTSMGWPSSGESLSAMKRAGISTGPPGAKGTTKRTGRVGQGACASAGAAKGVASRAQRRMRLR